MSKLDYTPTIGLEVHVELATKSKMFCGCKNAPHDSEPNQNVCPVCLAHPGTLPVPNQEAISFVLQFGEATRADHATFSEFDRKHYFYPDIPKAYQISQYAYPLLTGGMINGISITRVHLEEDTARNQHDKGNYSLVDFNRAGVPLMELVTEPVIHDAKTAGAFARELQLILRTLRIAEAQMERGEMRVEANVSVSADKNLGTKVEVKNLNSFRSVEAAIEYEILRQTTLLEAGGEVVQETRGWDEVKQRTYVQRSKETAKDYRYFPDPDIPKMDISREGTFSRVNERINNLPDKKRVKYSEIDLPIKQTEIIISSPDIDTFFAEFYQEASRIGRDKSFFQTAANYLTSDVLSHLASGASMGLSVEHYIELIDLVTEDKITSRVAKDVLAAVLVSNESPRAYAEGHSLLRSTDMASLGALVAEIMGENPQVVSEYRSGKLASLQFLIGQAMKKSRGTADPALLKEALLAGLDSK